MSEGIEMIDATDRLHLLEQKREAKQLGSTIAHRSWPSRGRGGVSTLPVLLFWRPSEPTLAFFLNCGAEPIDSGSQPCM